MNNIKSYFDSLQNSARLRHEALELVAEEKKLLAVESLHQKWLFTELCEQRVDFANNQLDILSPLFFVFHGLRFSFNVDQDDGKSAYSYLQLHGPHVSLIVDPFKNQNKAKINTIELAGYHLIKDLAPDETDAMIFITSYESALTVLEENIDFLTEVLEKSERHWHENQEKNLLKTQLDQQPAVRWQKNLEINTDLISKEQLEELITLLNSFKGE